MLYYNAFHPVEILETLIIKTSKINGKDRGLSMSSAMIDSHGPFTFVFKDNTEWSKQFLTVEYGKWEVIDTLHKPEMFRNEFELWSPEPVKFDINDVISVIFRMNSPGAKIYPIKTKRIAKKLLELYPLIYKE